MVMLTIELLWSDGYCRFDLGSGAAIIRSEFAKTINTVHISFHFLLCRMGQTGELSVDI